MAPVCSKQKNILSFNNNVIASLLILNHRNRIKKKRRIWVREVFQDRPVDGDFHNLIPKMRICYEYHNDNMYREVFRVTPSQFDYLLSLVKDNLTKQDTHYRKAISAKERLYITLRYLTTGDSYRTLSLAYRIGKSTVAKIVPETCNIIWNAVQPIYLPPLTKKAMMTSALNYFQKWNFPNCVGSLDGKHIELVAPPNSGSMFFNYKGTYSIVLMAVCDAYYKFTFIDIGNFGGISDGGVFGGSELGKAIEDENFFPQPRKIEENGPELPFCFVGDAAFPLKPNLMRPYAGRNLPADQDTFNYRLSRARMTIENSFGILSSRFRCLQSPIPLDPVNAEAVVKAAVCLHNFLMTKEEQTDRRLYCPIKFGDHIDEHGNLVKGEWRLNHNSNMTGLPRQGGRACRRGAIQIRDSYKEYFTINGKMEYQGR